MSHFLPTFAIRSQKVRMSREDLATTVQTEMRGGYPSARHGKKYDYSGNSPKGQGAQRRKTYLEMQIPFVNNVNINIK